MYEHTTYISLFYDEVMLIWLALMTRGNSLSTKTCIGGLITLLFLHTTTNIFSTIIDCITGN